MSLIEVTVKCSNSEKASFNVDKAITVGEFKQIVGQAMNVSAEAQRLIYKGRVLKDDLSLEHYGMYFKDS